MSDQPQPGCSSWYQDSPVQTDKSKESNIFIIKSKKSSQPAILTLSKCTTEYEDYGSISSMSLVSLDEAPNLHKVQVQNSPKVQVQHASQESECSSTTEKNANGLKSPVFGGRHHARSSTSSQPRTRMTRRERIRQQQEEAAVAEEEWIPEPVPRYLHTYLDFIFYSCLIPYKRENLLQYGETPVRKAWWKCFHYMQKAMFWTLAFLAILDSGIYAKFNFMNFLDNRKPDTFVDFGYHITAIIVRIFWIYIWTFWPARIGYALDSIENYEEHIIDAAATKNQGNRPVVKTIVKRILLFGAIIWIASLGKTIFSNGLYGKSFADGILQKSALVSQALLDWKVQRNGTDTYAYYYEQYGTKLTVAAYFKGILGILSDVAGRLQLLSIRDTFLILAVTLGRNLRVFAKSIEKYANMPFAEVRKEDAADMGTYWEMYRRAKDLVLDVNWAFGTLLKMLHACNEILFAYFMSYCLDKESSNTVLIWMLFTMAKQLYAYVDAALTHRYNTLCEKWIENWSRGTGKVKVGNQELRVKALLKELKREPFALGEGHFVIDELFVFKFLCFAVSLVLFLVNAAKE